AYLSFDRDGAGAMACVKALVHADSSMPGSILSMSSAADCLIIGAPVRKSRCMTNTTQLQYPQRGNGFSRALGKGFLQLFGWRLANAFPDVPKAVVIGGPHTSNWDGIFTCAAMIQIGLDAHIMMKDSAFQGPHGRVLRWLGAVPVDRTKTGGVVEQSVEQFSGRDRYALIVAPEGTRSGAEQWKTGFYHIA